ncbi:hypothetical protein TorRG33x02_188170, partial [Trema orientale]
MATRRREWDQSRCIWWLDDDAAALRSSTASLLVADDWSQFPAKLLWFRGFRGRAHIWMWWFTVNSIVGPS